MLRVLDFLGRLLFQVLELFQDVGHPQGMREVLLFRRRGEKLCVLQDGHGHERDLLGQHGHELRQGPPVDLRDVDAAQEDLSILCLEAPPEQFEHGGLPAAARPAQHRDPPARDSAGDVLQSRFGGFGSSGIAEGDLVELDPLGAYGEFLRARLALLLLRGLVELLTPLRAHEQRDDLLAERDEPFDGHQDRLSV